MDNKNITKEEAGDIKDVIRDMETGRQKAGKEFFEDLLGEKLE